MQAMGVLPRYTGIAEHDGWKAYRSHENCNHHALCHTHHGPELQGIIDNGHQD